MRGNKMEMLFKVFSDTSPHWDMGIALLFAASFAAVCLTSFLFGARGRKLAGIMLLYTYVFNVLVTTLLMREPYPYRRYTLEINIKKYLFDRQNEYQFCYELLNLFLIMPIGWFMPVLIKKHPVIKTFIFGLALTLFIEFTQLFTRLGEFQTDDIILNSLGCLIGAWTITAIGALFKALARIGKKNNDAERY